MSKQSQYTDFLSRKAIRVEKSGFAVEDSELNPMLFDWQRAIVKWALQRGKAAIFADCGLGKTPMQLEWAKHVNLHTGLPVLILAPLAVAEQTSREGEKFGIRVKVVTHQAEIENGVNVTNYEKLHHFSPEFFGGIVLDESSILKGWDGKTRLALTEFASGIPFRLPCTATPAPNDLEELTRHAEFLGVMQEKEVKALFFTQDGNSSNSFRLKGHAQDRFWEWMAQWAVALRKPSDLGYSDDGFALPGIQMHEHVVAGATPEGYLLPVMARTLNERRDARRASLGDRVELAADLVNGNEEQWVVWCNLNAESEAIAKSIPGAVEVAGRHSEEHKKDAMIGFKDGRYRVLVTKPSIAGFGMNWQNCHKTAYVGLSDSYEEFYQSLRRFWRFGQKSIVDCHVIISETEGAIVDNIRRKEKQSADMFEGIVKHMAINSDVVLNSGRHEMTYETGEATGDNWTVYLGDSVETIENVADDSIGLSIFSPPFPGMYVYTNSVHDMGNVKDMDEMIDQFSYLAEKILRKTMPGRSCAIHLTQGVAQKMRDGHIGLKDFRGKVISMMEAVGWIYYGEVTIDKNPQVKATRTKDRGLMFKTLVSDSALLHMALADFLLQFRKPGDNPRPIRAGKVKSYADSNGWITADEWILWARPVWYGSDYAPNGCEVHDGIKETDVLNVAQARETNDERHLCPLQLGVIERAIKLWSAPGDIVYSPFAGIGSEGYEAVRLGRRFIGGELKRSYWQTAISNLRNAEQLKSTPTIFDFIDRMATKENALL